MKAKITKVMSIVLAICLMTVIVVPTYATEVDTSVAPNASTETVFEVAEEAPQKVISFLDEYGVNVNSDSIIRVLESMSRSAEDDSSILRVTTVDGDLIEETTIMSFTNKNNVTSQDNFAEELFTVTRASSSDENIFDKVRVVFVSTYTRYNSNGYNYVHPVKESVTCYNLLEVRYIVKAEAIIRTFKTIISIRIPIVLIVPLFQQHIRQPRK